MATITEIEKLIAAGRLDDARDEIERLLAVEPQNSQAWFLLGGIYRRHELWGDAINAYNRAKLIEPEGPAAAAIESIYDIIRFVNILSVRVESFSSIQEIVSGYRVLGLLHAYDGISLSPKFLDCVHGVLSPDPVH